MHYFLTGATGFLGGALARQLAAAGHQVTALVRDPAKAEAHLPAGITFVKGDITDKESMRAPMTGADGVFHCAAWYKVGASAAETATAERTNVGGTRNVLELMRELRIPKGVYTSTVAVFSDTDGREPDESYYHAGPFLSEYDRTKWRAHYEVAVPMAREGLPLVILQPGVIYGPGDTSGVRAAFVQYLQGKLAGIPAKTAFSWAHVDDVAQVHMVAMDRGPTRRVVHCRRPVTHDDGGVRDGAGDYRHRAANVSPLARPDEGRLHHHGRRRLRHPPLGAVVGRRPPRAGGRQLHGIERQGAPRAGLRPATAEGRPPRNPHPRNAPPRHVSPAPAPRVRRRPLHVVTSAFR